MPDRNLIFVSYSHRDEKWLDRLRVNLRPLLKDREISPWDDHEIQPGRDWKSEIESALDQACVAVLLVSPDFLASDFIMGVEVPLLITAHRSCGIPILWVPVRASNVEHTEIAHYQAMSDPRSPLDFLKPAEQEAQLVVVSKAIYHHARPRDSLPPPPPKDEMQRLRLFDIPVDSASTCAVDERCRVWVCNGQQVLVLPIDPDQQVEQQVLPDRQWKEHLARTWQDGTVMSDWEGNLRQFSSVAATRVTLLHKAQADDLPIHRLAVAHDGGLIAVSWNGLVRTWNVDGKQSQWALGIEHLPLHVIPMPHGALAVVDQANKLRLYDASGSEVWSWQASETIEATWACLGRGQPAFLVQLGRWRVVPVVPHDEQQQEEQRFDEPIVGACLHRGHQGSEWLAVARDGGNIDWLSASPFRLIRGNSVRGGLPVRELYGVSWTRAWPTTDPACLGLTRDGQLFLVRGSRQVLFREPQAISRIVVDCSGRFLYVFRANRVELYRSPITGPPECQVELIDVQGTLVVDAFRKLTVTLKNTGAIPIRRLTGELSAVGIIEPCRCDKPPDRILEGGESFALEFSVRSQADGDAVPLRLKLELEDVAGPPISHVDLSLNVVSESRGLGNGG